MHWLRRHRAKVVIGLCLITALPAMIKSVRDTHDCFAEIRSASWSDRLMVFARVRACPSRQR